MELLFGLLLRFPSVFQAVGLGLASLSIAAIGLGLRFGRGLDRAERAASRVGVTVQIQLDQFLPWWLWPLIPETGYGFVAWGVVCISGLALAATAKKIKNAYY